MTTSSLKRPKMSQPIKRRSSRRHVVREQDDNDDMEQQDEYLPEPQVQKQTGEQQDQMDIEQADEDEDRYDPEQDDTERRNIRVGYRNLIEQVDDEDHMNARNILKNLDAADHLYNQVRNPNEATLDSKLLAASADLGIKRSKAMKKAFQQFDVQDFISRLAAFMIEEERDVDFAKLGRTANQLMHTAPRASFLLGTMSLTKKVRVQKARVKRDLGEKKVAAEVHRDGTETGNQTEATSNIMNIYGLLKMNEPMNFWELVINPLSFSQSVENLFYCAFLAKDDMLAVELDDFGVPQCRTKARKSDAELDVHNKEANKIQHFVTIDYAQWLKKIQEFNITESFIPNRQASEHHNVTAGGPANWY
ncbi:hypothetical protein MIR68_010375 [Amoeboaphelidium protococcarum]|nr:hypothetical protein MIR68_010375 [Amoeboaphelidium protococcarum]